MTKPKVPKALDAMVDTVLAYRPKARSKPAVQRKRRATGPLPPGAVTLPVFPFDPTLPDNTLPGSQPGIDNTLPGGGVGGGHPSGQPIVPGRKFVVKWFACQGLILVPDNTLPPTAEPKA